MIGCFMPFRIKPVCIKPVENSWNAHLTKNSPLFKITVEVSLILNTTTRIGVPGGRVLRFDFEESKEHEQD